MRTSQLKKKKSLSLLHLLICFLLSLALSLPVIPLPSDIQWGVLHQSMGKGWREIEEKRREWESNGGKWVTRTQEYVSWGTTAEVSEQKCRGKKRNLAYFERIAHLLSYFNFHNLTGAHLQAHSFMKHSQSDRDFMWCANNRPGLTFTSNQSSLMWLY